MQLAMICLGRIGVSPLRPLIFKCHEFASYELHPAVAALQKEGATGAASLPDLVAKTKQPRAIWRIAPAAAMRHESGGRVEEKAGGAE